MGRYTACCYADGAKQSDANEGNDTTRHRDFIKQHRPGTDKLPQYKIIIND